MFGTSLKKKKKERKENFRNKQFISFQLCGILSSMMKSLAIQLSSSPGRQSSLCPAYPIHYSLVALSVIRLSWMSLLCLWASNPYFGGSF